MGLNTKFSNKGRNINVMWNFSKRYFILKNVLEAIKRSVLVRDQNNVCYEALRLFKLT